MHFELNADKGIAMKRVSFVNINIPHSWHSPDDYPIKLETNEGGFLLQDIYVVNNTYRMNGHFISLKGNKNKTPVSIDGMVWTRNSISNAALTIEGENDVQINNVLLDENYSSWISGKGNRWYLSEIIGIVNSWENVIKTEFWSENIKLRKHGLTVKNQEMKPNWISEPTLPQMKRRAIFTKQFKEMIMKTQPIDINELLQMQRRKVTGL